MNVLLMGGSVFVGAALREHLLELGLGVTAVTRGVTAADWSGVEHIACDRNDPVALRNALRGRRFDAVVDASCYTAMACSNLLDALGTRPSRYVLISSAAVYDRTTARFPFRENDSVGGDAIWGDYGVGKYGAEQVLRTHEDGPRDGVFVLRPPYLYGPGNNLDREQFFWTRMEAGAPILVPGNGETLIQLCDIGDLASGVGRIVTSDGIPAGVYNVGEPAFYSFVQYLGVLADVAGERADLRFVTDTSIPAREYFPFRDNHLILDSSSIRSVGVGFTELAIGARRTLEWFKAHSSSTLERSPKEAALLVRFSM